MMFSVCLASFAFIITSSFSGMPISGTHTVIGALLGAGIVGIGAKNLAWHRLLTIVVSWVLSPALACIISLILMLLIGTLTMNTARLSFTFRFHSLQLIAGVAFLATAANITMLLAIKEKREIIMVASFFVGIIFLRLSLIVMLLRGSRLHLACCQKMCMVLRAAILIW